MSPEPPTYVYDNVEQKLKIVRDVIKGENVISAMAKRNPVQSVYKLPETVGETLETYQSGVEEGIVNRLLVSFRGLLHTKRGRLIDFETDPDYFPS
ncbi:hypothetical protein DPMN_133353 [Dreissena polymorpha]|uniref:Uncharacterized protein n=1 Tax=Dreissena polymorpha TaxID=45954 RepID=A0A9D4J9P4_DREPO|nr:hypothetical protein DPMN_133353 [Dreissena polymorpha]